MLNRLQKLQEYINGSERDRFLDYYAGKYFTGSITLSEDDKTGTLYFEQGHVAKVAEGIPESGVDLALGFTKEMWDEFPQLKRSTNIAFERYGTKSGCTMSGNPLRYRQFNGTVAQVFRLYSYIREDKPLRYDIPARDPEPQVVTSSVEISGFYVTVNGIKIYVETNSATKDKPVVICLHTAGRDNRQYHDIFQIIGDKYKIFAPDMPAHGKSWPLSGKPQVISDYKTYGKWIWDIVTALNVENPIVIGCSMAGGIVYHIAQEYSPRAVICMQGSDNTVKSGPAIDMMMDAFTNPGNNVAITQREFSDSLIGNKAAQSRVDFIRWGVETEVGSIKYGDFSECNTLDISDKMDKITCPVRIIEGTEDLGFTVEMAQGSYDRLINCKNKKLILLEGYGHFIIVENPEKVCEILDELIESL